MEHILAQFDVEKTNAVLVGKYSWKKMYKPSKKFIKDNNLQYYYFKKLEEIRSTDHFKK